MHRYGLQRAYDKPVGVRKSMHLRLPNRRNILTIETKADAGDSWRRFDVQMEVSGYHHNVAYDFLSLRPALYAAGQGSRLYIFGRTASLAPPPARPARDWYRPG